MGKLIRSILQEHICELNERLKCESGLLDRYISVAPPVLTIVEKGEILSQETSYKRNDTLVTLLMTKDDRALDILYTFLKTSGSLELAAALKKSAAAHGHNLVVLESNAGAVSKTSASGHFGLEIVEADPSRKGLPDWVKDCKPGEPCKKVENILMGVDLGTTYSCAGIWRNGKISLVQNEFGQPITASCVSFPGGDSMLVGDEAKRQADSNPTNTFYDAKRLIGRQFSDQSIQSDLKRWPFKVTANGQGAPVFVAKHLGNQSEYTPEQISSFILAKFKRLAEESTGCTVTDAVITVPANFTNAQREATKAAAGLSGLNLLQMGNEPTAAALAYGLDKKLKIAANNGVVTDETFVEGKNILVYDLGGGTFDVTILSIDINVEVRDTDGPASYFDVLGTDGNTHLGGQDFDARLVQHFLDQFTAENKVTPSPDGQEALSRLQTEAERVKKVLSTGGTSTN